MLEEISGTLLLLFPVTNITINFKKEKIMNLPNPVTIQPPSFTRKTGEVRTFEPITLSSLDVTIIDNSTRKSVVAQIRPCSQHIVLWEGEAYDVAGDYTQAQVEAKILELLGPDVKVGLEKLFVPPVPPARN
jgi:hypothetical protein